MSGYGLAAAPPSTNIYVAGLPSGIDDARLKEVFAAYGEVVWSKVLGEGRDGRVPGIVEFSNLEHATWVVANVNGGIPQGLTEPVDVKFKHERGYYGMGWGMGSMGGMGNTGKGYNGKGSNRYSPYGPPDSTGFDAIFTQAFAAATATAGATSAQQAGGWGCSGGAGGKGKGASTPAAKHADPVPSDNVYIKGLPVNCDDALLKQVFSVFGTIRQCRLCPGGDTKRTALVRFQRVDEATACIQGCNGQTPPAGLTDPVEVRFADTWDTKQKRSGGDGMEFSIEVIVKGFESSGLMPGVVGRYDSNNNCALYIAGLPSDTTDYHLFKLFSPLGPIAPRGVRALLNEDGTCKGIAFVNYQREDSVHAAIAVYNGAVLPDGSRLKVQQKAQKQPLQHMPPVPPQPPRADDEASWGGGAATATESSVSPAAATRGGDAAGPASDSVESSIGKGAEASVAGPAAAGSGTSA